MVKRQATPTLFLFILSSQSQLVCSSRDCVLTLTYLLGAQVHALRIRHTSENYCHLQKGQCHPLQDP